jgi:hypothetical protein
MDEDNFLGNMELAPQNNIMTEAEIENLRIEKEK